MDGPAGAGKSTVARAIARMFGLRYVSTGHIYRALTLKAIRSGADMSSEEALTSLARATDISVKTGSDGEPRTILDGEDVSADIASPAVDARVSQVSQVPGVRAALLELQRAISRQGGVVMDGRDIGTVVAPEADLKIFLVATLDERVRRRVAQARARGYDASEGSIAWDMARRDDIDSRRTAAPLRPAPDAVIIDTTGRTPDQTIAEVARLVAKTMRGSASRGNGLVLCNRPRRAESGPEIGIRAEGGRARERAGRGTGDPGGESCEHA